MRHFCKLVFKVGCSGDSCLSQLRYLLSLLIQPREQTSLKTLKLKKNHRCCFVIHKVTVIVVTEYFSNFSNQGRGKLIVIQTIISRRFERSRVKLQVLTGKEN